MGWRRPSSSGQGPPFRMLAAMALAKPAAHKEETPSPEGTHAESKSKQRGALMPADAMRAIAIAGQRAGIPDPDEKVRPHPPASPAISREVSTKRLRKTGSEATLEATQGQILSQSPTDATRFW